MCLKQHTVCVKQHIYSALAVQRRRLGISQKELAARAGLRREKVNRLESQGEDVSLEELSRLLDAVGLELAVCEKGKAPPSPFARRKDPDSFSARRLGAQDFRKASFIDGSKARIRSWGRLPR